MAQFSVKKIGQFDEAFFSKENWPILMAFKKKQKNGGIASYRTPHLFCGDRIQNSQKKGGFE